MYAWGHDHLRPDSRTYDDDLLGLAATLMDSLGSLHLMGLKKEYKVSREWIEKDFDLIKGKDDASLFETSIRIIGGLVSAYHLTGDTMFLKKAEEVGQVCQKCFETKSGLPHMRLVLSEQLCLPDLVEGCLYSMCNNGVCEGRYCRTQIAEVGTLGLEFQALSYALKNNSFARMINITSNGILDMPKWDGLVTRKLYADRKQFIDGSDVHTGPGIDSYYEYLLKMWVQSNFKATRFKNAYSEAIDGIYKHLTQKVVVDTKTFWLVGNRAQNMTFLKEIHHLSCFLPGTLALGYHYGLPKWHLKFAEELAATCYYMYQSQPTGLAPESVLFDSRGLSTLESSNNLRPETVESIYLLWRVTKDKKYREWGWNIFQAFERVSRTCYGYTNIADVGDIQSAVTDKMESFFLAETLKYLYLLFEEDESILSLDEWVFNTEAHPLPIHRHPFSDENY